MFFSRFYKDTLPPTGPLRKEHSQHSSSRHSLVTSRASSCESFNPILEEDDSTCFLVADAVAKLEFELNPNNETKNLKDPGFEELSPIRELGEQLSEIFAKEENNSLKPVIFTAKRRILLRSSASLDISDFDEKLSKNDINLKNNANTKIPRTPSAPMSFYSNLVKKRLLRTPLIRRLKFKLFWSLNFLLCLTLEILVFYLCLTWFKHA